MLAERKDIELIVLREPLILSVTAEPNNLNTETVLRSPVASPIAWSCVKKAIVSVSGRGAEPYLEVLGVTGTNKLN